MYQVIRLQPKATIADFQEIIVDSFASQIDAATYREMRDRLESDRNVKYELRTVRQ